MAQYDPNPAILEERCYVMAQQLALQLGDEWDWQHASDGELRDIREDVRSTLLEEFPDGPLIADLMDDGLRDIDFPLERAS